MIDDLDSKSDPEEIMQACIQQSIHVLVILCVHLLFIDFCLVVSASLKLMSEPWVLYTYVHGYEKVCMRKPIHFLNECLFFAMSCQHLIQAYAYVENVCIECLLLPIAFIL